MVKVQPRLQVERASVGVGGAADVAASVVSVMRMVAVGVEVVDAVVCALSHSHLTCTNSVRPKGFRGRGDETRGAPPVEAS